MRPRLVLFEDAAYILLFLLVAVAVDPAVEAEFTLPKLICLRLLIPVLAACWTLRLWTGAVVPPPPGVAIPVGGMALWAIASTPLALHVPTALDGFHGRYNGLWTQLLLIALFWMLASSRRGAVEIERLPKAIALVLVPVAGVALAQYVGLLPAWPSDRPPSTIGHPTILAAVLGLALPFLVVFVGSARSRGSRLGWGLALAAVLLAVGGTLSRGPWAGIACGLALLALGLHPRWRIPWGRAAVSALVVAVLVGGLIASDTARMGQMKARVQTLIHPLTDRSVRDRFVYYDAAVRIIRDYPVTGIGFENFALALPRYRPSSGETVGDNTQATMVHDGYLHSAACNGLPALALYLAAIGGVLAALYRARAAAPRSQRAVLATACAASICSYLVQDLSGWLEISLSVFFWSILGLAVALTEAPAADTPSRRPRAWVLAAGTTVGVGLIAGSLVLAGRSWQEYRAERRFAACQELEPGTPWSRVQTCLDDAVRGVERNAHYLEQAALFYVAEANRVRDPRIHGRGAELLDAARRLNPLDSYLIMHRVDLEAAGVRRGLLASARPSVEEAIREARRLDPTNPLVDESVARLRLAEGRTADALRLVKHALEVSPRAGRLALLEGDVLRAAGNRPRAIDAYLRALMLIPRGDADRPAAREKVVVNLLETGNFPGALHEARNGVEELPSDPTLHVLLGVAHQSLRQLPEARAAFEAALRVDPANETATRGLAQVRNQLAAPGQ